MLLAHTVAVVHGAAVVLMLTGAVVALWRPRVLWAHLPVSLAILAVNRAGAPCPLTEWELWLRAEAGGIAYDGGYLGHYVLSPMGLDVASRSAQAGIYTVALVPNVVGFALLAYRALRGRWSASRLRGRRLGSPALPHSRGRGDARTAPGPLLEGVLRPRKGPAADVVGVLAGGP